MNNRAQRRAAFLPWVTSALVPLFFPPACTTASARDLSATPSASSGAERVQPMPNTPPAPALKPPPALPPELRDPSAVRLMIEQYEQLERQMVQGLGAPPNSATNSDPILKLLHSEARTTARDVLDAPGRRGAIDGAREALDRGETERAAMEVIQSAATLRPLLSRGELLGQLTRLRAIGYYAERNLRAAAAANAVPVSLDDELRTRLSGLSSSVERGRFDNAMRGEFEEYNRRLDEAHRLVHQQAIEQQAKIPREQFATVARTTPCLAIKPPTSDADTAPAILLENSRAIAEFYPEDARREWYEGVVTLRVLVSNTGCVQTAAAVVKGPDPRLDQAAIRWMLEGATFRPGIHKGKPDDFLFLFNVRFKLND